MATVTELNLYPIKSCAGIALPQAMITEAGLMGHGLHDREWMVVDKHGNFITQRTCPKMALIQPCIKAETLELHAPGMPPLPIPLVIPSIDAPSMEVQVWDDRVQAYDCSEFAAQWFSDFLDLSCRLVRFHSDAKRIASTKWTNGIEAPTLFADGYPVLVISEASLQDLNDKLAAQGRPPLPMNRFRPNLVISGVEAFEEDYVESITLGNAVLRLVKPCPRCPVPSIDQSTGKFGPDPLDILRTYRANPRLDGAITFGMNAIVTKHSSGAVHLGQEAEIELAF